MRSFVGEHWFGVLLVAVVVTRLPFLFLGYGADADSWLVANSAATLWHTGTYYPSRLPGYPLHEFLAAPFVGLGGAPLSNAATLAVSLVAMLAWSRIVRAQCRNHELSVVALAFAPSVWQHSAETIDYMWSLCFILLAFLALHRKRNALAGVLLGAALGFRASNCVVIVPFLAYAMLTKSEWKTIVRMIVACLATTLVLFMPLVLRYGFAGWINATQMQMNDVYPESLMQRLIAFWYRTIYFIGPGTALVGAWILWNGRSELVEGLRSRQAMTLASVIAIATFLLQFFLLPLERAYLLGGLPFFLLLVDRASRGRQFLLFTIVLAVSGLVNLDVIQRDDRRAPGLNVRAGMVIDEMKMRNDLLNFRAQTPQLRLPDSSIVMTGSGPTLALDNSLLEPSLVEDSLLDPTLPGYLHFEGHRKVYQRKGNATVLFVMYLTRVELDRARKAGFAVFSLESRKKHIRAGAGDGLDSVVVRPIR